MWSATSLLSLGKIMLGSTSTFPTIVLGPADAPSAGDDALWRPIVSFVVVPVSASVDFGAGSGAVVVVAAAAVDVVVAAAEASRRRSFAIFSRAIMIPLRLLVCDICHVPSGRPSFFASFLIEVFFDDDEDDDFFVGVFDGATTGISMASPMFGAKSRRLQSSPPSAVATLVAVPSGRKIEAWVVDAPLPAFDFLPLVDFLGALELGVFEPGVVKSCSTALTA